MINTLKWACPHFFLTIKWFHLFQSNKNTQLNVKTVLFQTIQFSISTVLLVYSVKWSKSSILNKLSLACQQS